MVEEVVQEIKHRFQDEWWNRLNKVAIFALDGSWPSVGVLDLLTYALRGQQKFDPFQLEILRGTAAYLAIMAHDCWRSFGVESQVRMGRRGVEIIAQSGPGLENGEEFFIPLEQRLGQILEKPPRNFNILNGFTRSVSHEENIIAPFAIGLMCGLTPYGEGPWRNETVNSFTEQIEAVVKLLSMTYSEAYARLFPDEQLGQVAEVYLNSLIFPPAFLNENLPACQAVHGLVKTKNDFQLTNTHLLNLSRNLALMPDDLSSMAGLASYAALQETLPDSAVIANSQRRGAYVGMLRQAMLLVREALELEDDWLARDEVKKGDLQRIEIERQLGFMPWVQFSSARVQDKQVKEIVRLLVRFDLAEAKKLIDKLISESPKLIDMRIQRVVVDMLEGDAEAAEGRVRRIITEPGCENNPVLYDQWGLAELSQGKFEEASRHFKLAVDNISLDTAEAYKIRNNYGWSLMLLEKYEESLQMLEQAIKDDPCPVTAMLNKSFVLRQLGRTEELAMCDLQLQNLAPLDRRVFGNLLLSGLL